jgi:hypothetical protein
MERLSEVENAKALMTEAVAWSVMKWLREKKRVRKTADEANVALDRLSENVKSRWPDDVIAAYDTLAAQDSDSKTTAWSHPKKPMPASEAWLVARNLKEADDDAYRARMDAEQTFDEAEVKLSTALAREGCRKAIHAWDLKEIAIRKAETIRIR